MNKFVNYCKELNEKCVAAQESCKEIVTEETAVKAIYIVKYMRLCSLGDALLYSAALNVLNTYVKQDNGDKPYIGYFFKKNADILAQFLVDHYSEGMDLELQHDRGMTLLVVNLFGIQCSFHRVNLSKNVEKLEAVTPEKIRIKWDGVRKQNCANTFFEGALNNPYLRKNKLMDGGNLIEGISSVSNRYEKGLINIKRVV